MEEEQELDGDGLLNIVPDYRIIIDTQIQVFKREADLTEEQKENLRIKRILSSEDDDDEDDEDEDSLREWLDISLDISKITAVSKGEHGLAMLWFGMENAPYNMKYEMALAIFRGDITINDILDLADEDEEQTNLTEEE